mgnify:CR=1 FL=1
MSKGLFHLLSNVFGQWTYGTKRILHESMVIIEHIKQVL